MSQKLNAAIAVIGIDIGKNSFHLVGHDPRGAIVLRQTWSRGQVETRLANLPPCLIGMEACVGAHHLSRRFQSLGHDARLMPAKYVRPYSKGQKNDFRDAEAIAEAVQRPTMKFVATKTADQLDLQALHRVRDRLVGQRTGVINQIRAFLLERGIAVRQGLHSLRFELPGILATRTDVLLPRMLRIQRRAASLTEQTMSCRSPMLRANLSMRVTIRMSPLRRKSKIVRNSSCPAVCCLGAAALLRPDDLAARSAQGILLQFKVLVGRAYAGIADDGHVGPCLVGV